MSQPVHGVTAPKTKVLKKQTTKTKAESTAEEQVFRRKDLMTLVAARTGLRPNQARDVVDAVLDEIGEALVRGDALKIPPLGVVKVNRHKEREDADVMFCKVRRNKKTDDQKAPLAPAAE